METKREHSVTPAVLSGQQLDAYLSISRHMRHKIRRTDPMFPKPISLGSGRPYYLRAAVDAWIAFRAHDDATG